MGDGEKAMSHYKQSGPMVDAKEVSQAQALKKHISRINEARRLRDWETVEEESQKAISSGADSAPQVNYLGPHPLLCVVNSYILHLSQKKQSLICKIRKY